MTADSHALISGLVVTEEELCALASQLNSGLKTRGKAVSVAESCTGGLLAEVITRQSGASAVFEMGVVVYANRIKTQLLGVSPATLEQYGAVSQQTAIQMATGLARASGADYNLAITGIAGPDGGSPEKPVGTVYLALAQQSEMPGDARHPCCRWDHVLFTPTHTHADPRQAIRIAAAAYAIQMVLQETRSP